MHMQGRDAPGASEAADVGSDAAGGRLPRPLAAALAQEAQAHRGVLTLSSDTLAVELTLSFRSKQLVILHFFLFQIL